MTFISSKPMWILSLSLLSILSVSKHAVDGFLAPTNGVLPRRTSFGVQRRERIVVLSASEANAAVVGDFIGTELRGAAMRLHTRQQAPKEGQAESRPMEPYTPTREDYLQFLVDSQHVYQAFEDIIGEIPELAIFRQNGLERVTALETDINFMTSEYGLTRPAVAKPGMDYAETIRKIGAEKNIPKFICHYYNHYFAHTAGGRMIGKQMSALLLDKKTLEFYKWDGDLNAIKARVKEDIEKLVATWSRQEKDDCVNETGPAFQGGGMINSHLSGGQSSH